MDQFAHTTRKAVITTQIVDQDFFAAITLEKIKQSNIKVKMQIKVLHSTREYVIIVLKQKVRPPVVTTPAQCGLVTAAQMTSVMEVCNTDE